MWPWEVLQHRYDILCFTTPPYAYLVLQLLVTEVHALYGRLSCGWLRVVCAWRNTLRWEVGVAGWARSLHGMQLGATGGARRVGAFLVYATFSEMWELEWSQTAEVTFKVTQGHWCWRHSIDHMWFYHNYVFALYCFWDIVTYLRNWKGHVTQNTPHLVIPHRAQTISHYE